MSRGDGAVTVSRATWTGHRSSLDASVNFTRPTDDGGMFECRYVRRNDEYFIAYVSSHTGCRHACRFCHLTQTGQTSFTPASVADLCEQMETVLDHHDRQAPGPRRMNVNFMARGEPLSSAPLMMGFSDFAARAGEAAAARNLDLRLNISTIMPEDSASLNLAKSLCHGPVRLYWSLYSLDPSFRKRWLPRSQDPTIAADRLAAWQELTGGDLILHWALIEGENDSAENGRRIAEFVRERGLRARLNLVRYNSHGEKTGREASPMSYARTLAALSGAMKLPGSKVVARVGLDVKASCGMFMTR